MKGSVTQEDSIRERDDYIFKVGSGGVKVAVFKRKEAKITVKICNLNNAMGVDTKNRKIRGRADLWHRNQHMFQNIECHFSLSDST